MSFEKQATLAEMEMILETVRLYQDGHAGPDMDKLKQAFHPKAHVVGYYQGALMFDSRDEYLDVLAAEEAGEIDGEAYTKVLSLDKTDTTAIVKIESLMAGTRFISQLSMIRLKDQWQIIAGLFHGLD